MNLLEDISKIDDEEKVYYEYRSRDDKYKQLTKIVEKLHAKTNTGSKDV